MAEKFCNFVDGLNEWVGTIFSWLFFPITFGVAADVFTRYALNKPWFYLDINVQIMGIITAMGLGYCYLQNGHVSVDILITGLSKRKRAILDIILFPLVLGAIVPWLWKVLDDTVYAVSILQNVLTSIPLPVYPFKIMVVIGISLLLLEGISKFIRNLKIVFPARPGGNP